RSARDSMERREKLQASSRRKGLSRRPGDPRTRVFDPTSMTSPLPCDGSSRADPLLGATPTDARAAPGTVPGFGGPKGFPWDVTGNPRFLANRPRTLKKLAPARCLRFRPFQLPKLDVAPVARSREFGPLAANRASRGPPPVAVL